MTRPQTDTRQAADVDEELRDIRYEVMSGSSPSLIVQQIDDLRVALAASAEEGEPAGLRGALVRIRDLTLDVPAAHGDPESYYLGQLRTAIGTAARALAASTEEGAGRDWHPYPSGSMGPCVICGQTKVAAVHSSLAASAEEGEPAGLEEAWAAVHAAGEYGRVRSLVEYKDGWEAVWTDGHRVVGDFGKTPVAALLALAARLVAPTDRSQGDPEATA